LDREEDGENVETQSSGRNSRPRLLWRRYGARRPCRSWPSSSRCTPRRSRSGKSSCLSAPGRSLMDRDVRTNRRQTEVAPLVWTEKRLPFDVELRCRALHGGARAALFHTRNARRGGNPAFHVTRLLSGFRSRSTFFIRRLVFETLTRPAHIVEAEVARKRHGHLPRPLVCMEGCSRTSRSSTAALRIRLGARQAQPALHLRVTLPALSGL